MADVTMIIVECGPTTSLRPACGRIQRFQRPADAFRENLLTWNLLKSVWGYICLTDLLALDKVNLHKNNTFSCTILFIYFFTIKLEGAARRQPLRWGTCLDDLCVFSVPHRSLSSTGRCLQENTWRNEPCSVPPKWICLSIR